MRTTLLLVAFLKITVGQAPSVVVNLPIGRVTGYHVDYGNDTTQLYYGRGDIFLGIPFAQPPIGNLRFALTQPLTKLPNWNVNATKFGPACPQSGSSSCASQSEDCLHLNIFTPKAASVFKYPVMVWIHGGSLMNGCAEEFSVKGAVRNLVARGVVVVTIQYRLNVPGFFTTSTDDFPPNRGMYDQLEALKWVRKFIYYFGGNPYAVTLFGQSAGSISVSAHTYSPLSRGFFQKGIMESGAVFTLLEGELGYANLSQHRAQQLCNFTDWRNGAYGPLKECMLGMTPDQWIPLDQGNLFGWRIVSGDRFLPLSPQNLNDQRARIPMMIGNMHDEFIGVFYSILKSGVPFSAFSQGLLKQFFTQNANFYGDKLNEVFNVLQSSYLPPNVSASNSAAWFRSGSDMFTAAAYTQFILKDIMLQLENGNENIYVYEQTYGTLVGQWNNISQYLNGYQPVPHSTELNFIWMPEGVWRNAINESAATDFDFYLASWYGTTWTNFAKYGRPMLTNDWTPARNPKNIEYFKIDSCPKYGMQMHDGYRQLDRIVFNDAISALVGTPSTKAPRR